jgi:hypothetical protein
MKMARVSVSDANIDARVEEIFREIEGAGSP